MGILFVLFLYFIIIFITSLILAIIALVISLIFSKKENRKRVVLMSVFSPFVGFFTLSFCLLFSTILISEIKKIDIGIGDIWYIPLPNNCQLTFIDVPEKAFIKKNNQTVISDVIKIQQTENLIFGKRCNNTYFSYNTKTNELLEFCSENELITQNSNNKPNLIKATDFYNDKRAEIAGFLPIFAGIYSLILSILAVYLLKRIIFLKEKSH